MRRHLLLPLLLASGFAAAEPGTVLKATELRAKPFGDAEVLDELDAKSTVDIVTRQGAWAQVKAGGKSGWVRLLNLRTGSGQRGDAGAGALASVFKTGSSGNTVTTGVKGLSEEKLKAAEPDPAEAKRLSQYRETEATARGYAKQAKLATQQVGYFDANGEEIRK
ncbi:MAG: hypothetical protein K0S46_1693 [Moraxellaceae bacterium]|jgi:hypothetical protein|nr:hypothetical protein [Moraxellaceae bacterium]